MKVLTVNDRYRGGGAATIARSVYEGLKLYHGVTGYFCYGFDNKGFPGKSFVADIVRGPKVGIPHLNAALYPFIGDNWLGTSSSRLVDLMEKVDIVHLHNIHDYSYTIENIVVALQQTGKPVVITAHDSWYITGRCSIRTGCDKWKNGCGACPSLNNYHRVFIDNSGKNFIKRRKSIALLDKVKFVSPSNALAEDFRVAFPTKEVVVINNGVKTTNFSVKLEGFDMNAKSLSQPTLLLIDSNFTNSPKIDYEFVDQLLEFEGFRLVTVGSNSPWSGENILNHGYVDSQAKLIDIMHKSDALLYFSQVDIYPLTLVEALCAGLRIYGYDSDAFREITLGYNASVISPVKDFLDRIKKDIAEDQKSGIQTRLQSCERAIQQFSNRRMISAYYDLYQSML